MKQKTDIIVEYAKPSWLMNVLAGLVGVGLTAGVIISTLYYSSSVRLQVANVQAQSIVDQQQGAFASISLDAGNSSFISTLPLLITWAGVGLVVYFFAATITRGFGIFANWREQIGYVNASPKHQVRSAFTMLGIRLLALVIWFGFLQLTTDVLVPYALACAAAATIGLSAAAIGYALLAVAVLYLTVIIHGIFLRVVLLRPRVFGL